MKYHYHNTSTLKIALGWAAIAYVGLLALGLLVATVGAALAVWPWVSLAFVTASGAVDVGPAVQMVLTGLALTLLLFLPSSMRVLRLENSHRDFMISMEDVHKAYVVAHAEDRAGLFKMASEFDAVRERLNFMRSHPELSRLEPDVLEAAAQMSQVSRELADVYSDENVARARTVLRQRQQELQDFNDQLHVARRRTDEIKRWTEQLQAENDIADTQLSQLKDDLSELLPPLGFKIIKSSKSGKTKSKSSSTATPDSKETATNVVSIGSGQGDKTAAE